MVRPLASIKTRMTACLFWDGANQSHQGGPLQHDHFAEMRIA